VTAVSLDTLHAEWMKRPEYRAEYEALDLDFRVAAAIINARAKAALTQSQFAEPMKTSWTAVVRMERGHHLPSLATLRKVAEATGQRITWRSREAQRRDRTSGADVCSGWGAVTHPMSSPLRGERSSQRIRPLPAVSPATGQDRPPTATDVEATSFGRRIRMIAGFSILSRAIVSGRSSIICSVCRSVSFMS